MRIWRKDTVVYFKDENNHVACSGAQIVSVEITIFITFLISHHFVALSDGILVVDVPKMGIIFNKSL